MTRRHKPNGTETSTEFKLEVDTGQQDKEPNRLKQIRAVFIGEERAAIQEALEQSDWVQSHAAKILGTCGSSLQSALRRHPELQKEAHHRARRTGRPRKNKE